MGKYFHLRNGISKKAFLCHSDILAISVVRNYVVNDVGTVRN